MARPRHRAWRFVHPDFDRAEGEAGLRVTNTGGIAMVEDEAAVRQAVLLLLGTRPGERVMRPDYGCDLNKLLFSPNDDTTAGLAIHYVRRALERWEPRLEITDLDAERDGIAPDRLNIVLAYRVRATRRPDRLLIPVDLS